MSDHDKHGAPKGPTFLSCPFCGRNPDPTDPSTLHPTGTVWRDEAEFRSYHSHSERQEGDGLCWVFSCLTESGGCGAEVHGDSEEQAIAAWNRRCAPSATVPRDKALLDAIQDAMDRMDVTGYGVMHRDLLRRCMSALTERGPT